MRFAHSREYLNAGDVVVVDCSHQCNVRVMQDADFQRFQRGGSHHYHGGFFRMLPARIVVPHSGYWNVTVDVAGSRTAFRYNIGYLKAAA